MKPNSAERREQLATIYARGVQVITTGDSLDRREAVFDFEDTLIANGLIEVHDEVLDIAIGDRTLILMLDTGEGIEIDQAGNHTKGML